MAKAKSNGSLSLNGLGNGSQIAAEVDQKNKVLVIRLPLESPYETDKMVMIATTRGFRDSTLIIEGRPLKVNVNAGLRKA